MKRKNMTRNALVSSIISLLLCVSMLVGTTFAWFTDEVASANNIIKAGNLDVEVTTDEGNVEELPALFDDVTLWEPGVVAYENLTVANVGTLALQYKMDLGFSEENTVTDNGLGLSDVLKVAVIDEKVTDTNRDNVVNSITNWTLLGDLDEVGKLYPAGNAEGYASEDAFSIVIWWEPSDQDNKWNVNNGRTTSDGEPLHITLGLNLFATQLSYEEDSFGNDYDVTAMNPDADVNDWAQKTIDATIGMGGEVVQRTLGTAYQFLPSETKEEAIAGGYGDWHADFVVYTDMDVKAGQAGLAGFYSAWCDLPAQGGKWVALEGVDLPANEKVRLVDAMGEMAGVNITVAYKEICEYGIRPENTIDGFLCGAWATEELAGMTLTVELWLYEATSASRDSETGESVLVDTFTWTVPAVGAATTDELKEVINDGISAIALAAGEYKMPSSTTNADITISGTKDAVLDVTKGAYLDYANVTIKGVTIKTSTGYVMDDAGNQGSDYAALYSKDVTYIDCTFDGPMKVGRDGAKFINCTFNNLGNDYVWTYGNDVTFEGCTFNTDGKAILIYSDGGNEVSEVSVKNCVFNSTQGAKAGAIANQNCAAIEIHNYGNGVNLVTEGNTFDSNFSGEWRIKTYESGKPAIFVNGTEYTTIVLDGKTMTIDANRNVTVNP